MPTGGERTLNAVNTESSTGNVSIPEDSSGVPSSDQRSEVLNQGASAEDFGPDIETYRDERGRTRVSRVRGLGIRMTRDLQHNLDLILKNENDSNKNYGSVNDGEAVNQHDGDPNEDGQNQSFGVSPMEETPMEVSFSMDVIDGDDEVFSQLVTGESTIQFPLESCSLGKDTNTHYSVSDSDADWEDGPVEDKSTNKSSINENDGLDWEDGGPQTRDLDTFISRGLLEEEYEIQEAIKRSLEDFNQPSLNENLLHDSPSEKNAIDSSNSPQSNGQRGLQDGESEIEVEIKRSLENFNQQSLDGTLPQDSSSVKNATYSSPISPQGNCQGGLLEEESEIQEKIQRSLENVNQQSISGTLIKDSPSERDVIDSWASSLRSNGIKRLQEEESEIKEAIKRIHEDFNHKSLNGALLWDSSCDKNAIDSSPLSPKCDGPTSTQQITQGFDRLVDSPESLPPANATGLEELIRNTDIPEKVLFSQSNDDCVVLSESPIKKTSTTALDGGNSSIGEHKVHSSPRGSSDNYVMMAEPDKIPGTVPEDKYKHDSSTHQNTVLRREALEAELGEELSHLSRECRDLGDEQRRLERNAESVNNEMFAECQELLQMFGLPFIIAPMEAEAQCAYMEMMNLVDGIVTDDSDAFLFGAQNVYKNIFDDRKYVETYLMKDIENELGLTREKLIHMALLLGSDYTEGISGIGIVNAIEVVHAFPEEDGLREFREWVESPDPSIFGKLYPHIGDEAKRRSSKTKNAGGDGFGLFEGDEGDGLSDVKRTFMEKHRNVSKNWHIPSSFPSGSVISAYITPQVDGSTDPFSWGKPDLPLLRRLCWEKFGWAHQKAEELLVPVLKEYNKHETQLRMEAFYTFNERFAKIRSQRIKRAVKGITGKSSKELMNDSEEGNKLKGKRGRKSSSEIEEEKEENPEIKRGQRGSRGRGRGGRRGREAAREIKSVAAEDGGSSDSSDYSPQEGHQVDIASTSSEPRRSTRRKISTQKETVEVNMSNKESQPSPIQSPIVQEQFNDTAVSSKGDCSYLQGGGGFCVDEDQSQLLPGQPGSGAEEEQVNARGFCGVVEEKEEREEIPKGETVDNREEVGVEETPSVLIQRDKEVGGFSFTPMASLRRKRRASHILELF